VDLFFTGEFNIESERIEDGEVIDGIVEESSSSSSCRFDISLIE